MNLRSALTVLILPNLTQEGNGYLHPQSLTTSRLGRLAPELRNGTSRRPLFPFIIQSVTVTSSTTRSSLYGLTENSEKSSPSSKPSSYVFASYKRRNVKKNRFDTSAEATNGTEGGGGDPLGRDSGRSKGQAIYHTALGLVKSAFLFLLKLILLRPYRKLKSIMKRKRSADDACQGTNGSTTDISIHDGQAETTITDDVEEEGVPLGTTIREEENVDDGTTLRKLAAAWSEEVISNFERAEGEAERIPDEDVEPVKFRIHKRPPPSTPVPPESEMQDVDGIEDGISMEVSASQSSTIEVPVDESVEGTSEGNGAKGTEEIEAVVEEDVVEEMVTKKIDEVEVETVKEPIGEAMDASTFSDLADSVDEQGKEIYNEVTDEIAIESAEDDTVNSHNEKVLGETVDAVTTEETHMADELNMKTTKVESTTEVVSEDIEEEQSVTQEETTQVVHQVDKIESPTGKRWAVSAPNVDLSGKWKIVVTDDFKDEYDQYLKNLGQPSLVRSVAVSIVEMTTEEVIQSDDGRALRIKGRNLRGVWDRTLIASGSDLETEHAEGDAHTLVPLITADKENVQAESWWKDDGTVHISWLRGVKKYGGGDFESRRFLEDEGKRFVCESSFHPNDRDEEIAIRWVFEKIG